MKSLLVLALLFSVLPLSAARAENDGITQPLDLKFTTVEGKQFDLSKMRGKVVLIDFWATWCPVCQVEAPDVVAAYKKFHDQGFDIVGISLDQDKSALLSFTKEHGMVWPQYFDGKGWDNDVSSSFGVQELPAMLIIGKDGKIVHPDNKLDFAQQVEQLVKAPAR